MPRTVILTGNLNLQPSAYYGNHHSLRPLRGLRALPRAAGDESIFAVDDVTRYSCGLAAVKRGRGYNQGKRI